MPIVKHKSRKELRHEAAAHAQSLADLQTPEGLAGLVFEKSKDEDFHIAFRNALEALYQEPDEFEPETEPDPEPAQAPAEA
jgi:hypothetical protein